MCLIITAFHRRTVTTRRETTPFDARDGGLVHVGVGGQHSLVHGRPTPVVFTREPRGLSMWGWGSVSQARETVAPSTDTQRARRNICSRPDASVTNRPLILTPAQRVSRS